MSVGRVDMVFSQRIRWDATRIQYDLSAEKRCNPNLSRYRLIKWQRAVQTAKGMKLMRISVLTVAALVIGLVQASIGQAACCYFSAKNSDILQPAQKVFITWDPAGKAETFTVQPKFEGNAIDFGMVIPTPTQPTLHEMPRDFFKH